MFCNYENLASFPFDRNSCQFTIYIQNSPQIYYPDSQLNTFDLLKAATVSPPNIYMYNILKVVTNLSRPGAIQVDIVLKRNFFTEFARSSFPTMLLSIVIFATNLFYAGIEIYKL